MKFKKTTRYIIILSSRAVCALCLILCASLIALSQAGSNNNMCAYSYVIGSDEFSESLSQNCSDRLEFIGQVYMVDTSVIIPAIKSFSDFLSVNAVYLSSLTRGCAKYLYYSFKPVSERIVSFLPIPAEYKGSASEV